jgi:hypothetical protein
LAGVTLGYYGTGAAISHRVPRRIYGHIFLWPEILLEALGAEWDIAELE